MDANAILTAIQQQAANVPPLGASLKFELGDMAIHIDGKGSTNIVTLSHAEADCTISTDPETFTKLRNGEINPMMAVMSGLIKIKGDMGVAMKLQSLIQ